MDLIAFDLIGFPRPQFYSSLSLSQSVKSTLYTQKWTPSTPPHLTPSLRSLPHRVLSTPTAEMIVSATTVSSLKPCKSSSTQASFSYCLHCILLRTPRPTIPPRTPAGAPTVYPYSPHRLPVFVLLIPFVFSHLVFIAIPSPLLSF